MNPDTITTIGSLLAAAALFLLEIARALPGGG